MADGANLAGQKSIEADLRLALADTYIFSNSVISDLKDTSEKLDRFKVQSDRAMKAFKSEKERRAEIEDKYNLAKKELENLRTANELARQEIERYEQKSEANTKAVLVDRQTQTLCQMEAISRFSANFRLHVQQLTQIQDAQRGVLDVLLKSLNSVDVCANGINKADHSAAKQDVAASINDSFKNAHEALLQLAAVCQNEPIAATVDASAPVTKDLDPPNTDSISANIGATNHDVEMRDETPTAVAIAAPYSQCFEGTNQSSINGKNELKATLTSAGFNDAEKVAQLENELNKYKSEATRWALKYKHLSKKHESMKDRLLFREKEVGAVLESLKTYARSISIKHSNEA